MKSCPAKSSTSLTSLTTSYNPSDFDDQAKVNLETSKEVTTTSMLTCYLTQPVINLFLCSSADSLRGMKVVAATTFHLSGRRQTHVWEGHGLGLHLPEGALPPNHTGCRVDVRAGLAGQFEFSEGSRPVSGMYWLSCKETFLQSVTLELQHCVIVRDASQCSRLRFAIAKCSQPELPYKFKSLDRGYVFIPNSSYGSISLSQFSIVVITEQTSQDGEGSQEPQQPLQHAYCAKLFYLHEVSSQWQLDFIITQDLELYHKVSQAGSKLSMYTSLLPLHTCSMWMRLILPCLLNVALTLRFNLRRITFPSTYQIM